MFGSAGPNSCWRSVGVAAKRDGGYIHPTIDARLRRVETYRPVWYSKPLGLTPKEEEPDGGKP